MSEAGRLARSDSDLLRFAMCANDYASLITDRWDLVVRAGKGLGRGAPACFIPATAEIELDADSCMSADKARLDKIGWHLNAIDMARPKHRALVPVTTGALAHECGHSLFSVWPFAPGMKAHIASEPKQVVQLAMALEEGRQETRLANQVKGIRPYLTRTLNAIIMPGMSKVTADDPYAVLTACALILPRQNGWSASLSVSSLYRATDDALGAGTYERLSETLGRAFYAESADTDGTCLDIARQWWEMLPESAKDSTPSGGEGPSCPAHGDSDDSEAGSGEDALAHAKEWAETCEAREATADDDSVRAARESEKSVGGKEASERKGPSIHSFSGGGSGVIGRRAPTAAESATAKRLGAILRSAQTVAKVRAPKAVPPGRLRGRAAVEWSRDRSMGKATSVNLFRGKTRGEDIPPVRMGLAFDVSGSMRGACNLAASLGWTLAASAWDAEALVAGVCFGNELYPYVEVGKAHSDVRKLDASDGTEVIFRAVDYLDKSLNLLNGDGPRILVIISDGEYTHSGEQMKAAKWLTDFSRSGGTIIYVGMGAHLYGTSYLKGFPLPPKAGVHDAPLDLTALAATIGAAIRKAYARM